MNLFWVRILFLILALSAPAQAQQFGWNDSTSTTSCNGSTDTLLLRRSNSPSAGTYFAIGCDDVGTGGSGSQPSGADGSIQFNNASAFAGSSLFKFNSANLSVGIGTANPSSSLKLDVAGAIGASQFCDSDGLNCYTTTQMAAGGGGGAVDSVNGQTGVVVLDTGDISEDSNLYFTDERAQDAVGGIVNGSLTYTDGTPLLAVTSRTIGGVAYDATANIVPQTAQIVDSTDASSFPAIYDSATGNLQAKTDAGLTYNATSAILGANGGIGIGTVNPSSSLKLDVEGAAGATLYCDESGLNCFLASTVLTDNDLGTTVQAWDGALQTMASNTTNGMLAVTTSGNNTVARSITGTSNQIDVTNGNGVSGNPTLAMSATYAGQSSITTVGTLIGGATGTGFTVNFSSATLSGVVPGINGGTGIANSGKTITLGGNLVTSGAHATTLTTTGTTGITLPTTGTLATLAGSESLTNKSVNSVTLVSGGTSTEYLSEDGTYTVPAGGSATSAAGANGTIQFNNASAFAGDSNFNFNSATDTVTIGAVNPSSSLKLDVEGAIGADIYCNEGGTECFSPTQIANSRIRSFGFSMDGSGSPISSGVKGDIIIPYPMNITGWTVLADTTGTMNIEVWKDTYANFPPTTLDSISGSEPINFSSASKNQDNSLTSWSIGVTTGDIIRFNVPSTATSITRVNGVIYGTVN